MGGHNQTSNTETGGLNDENHQAEQRGIEKAVGRFTEIIGACPDVLPYATKHKMVVRALIAYDRFLFKELEKLKQ